MRTSKNKTVKIRGSADISYLGQTVDSMIWDFMREKNIPGLTLAIVQAPYIPRVIGYGLADSQKKLLSGPNTMYPLGPISQAYCAVAVMQCVEDNLLTVEDKAIEFVKELPVEWKDVRVIDLLRHCSGIKDFRNHDNFDPFREYKFGELINLAAGALTFKTGSRIEQSATNFLILSRIVERVTAKLYEVFVHERQIDYLGLKHIGFSNELNNFTNEDVVLTNNIHELFKGNKDYIDPTEPAASYDLNGLSIKPTTASALRGFSDIWAAAGDVSFWDIALAGSVLIHKAENRKLIYAPFTLDNGQEIPGVAGWQFYQHRGLMDIKGSVSGYSAFLSRFTHSEELVCVTLLANKDHIDFTNLARKIAGAFGDLLSTNYDDEKLYLYESQFSVEETTKRLRDALQKKNIPVFAEFDHEKNASGVGLKLRPTRVVVFGSPLAGTSLMQENQSVALELPLKIAIWKDELGSIWLAFKRMELINSDFDLKEPAKITTMQLLLEELVRKAGSLY